MYKIFIVEDDPAMAAAMRQQLEAWGNQVRCVKDFQNVLKEFQSFDPHLVLMDIMLPFFNGYHWCQEIRKVSGVPVVFLSSADDKMNIVMAINMGGDDFISKPFDLEVFTAKIQAVLRRAYDMREALPVLEHRGALLHLSDMTLTYQDQKVELTRNEFRILETLMGNKGKVVRRETLMTRLWEIDCYVEENTLTVNIGRLRRKLEAIGLEQFIKTKVGSGYLID